MRETAAEQGGRDRADQRLGRGQAGAAFGGKFEAAALEFAGAEAQAGAAFEFPEGLLHGDGVVTVFEAAELLLDEQQLRVGGGLAGGGADEDQGEGGEEAHAHIFLVRRPRRKPLFCLHGEGETPS